ncbi:tannase/feruloyl esterase family alpha/beta hydrolase [Bradyrhizobium sp.]|uniref:tannase/feruloyl esterase family alpha/beta hydrolase n=1 Tax=Bradyrhizobium sp. TaxID=376 RepID=UPI0025B9CACF|nr:tannase/feruloyl esterase family alpha/beta hydrolase [Bradyrhizobium sp.]
MTNFAYAAYKKARDVAVALMQRRYGRGPSKLYYVGFSEGGREGITMAQRFPNDFDGILSGVPVINWVGLMTAFARIGDAQLGEGWLSPQKVKVVQDAVLQACDQLDGLADGIISDPDKCKEAFDPAKLACRGENEPTCLTAPQLQTVKAVQKPLELNFTLANGNHTYPGWGYGGEAAAGSGPVGGWVNWQTGATAPALPPSPTNSIAWVFGSGAVQYFFARDPNYDPTKFEPSKLAERMKEVSALMDSTKPDLSAFSARGAKLIMFENMADYAQSPYAGIEYYKSVQAKMGTAKRDSFSRLYLLPGVDHMGSGAP